MFVNLLLTCLSSYLVRVFPKDLQYLPPRSHSSNQRTPGFKSGNIFWTWRGGRLTSEWRCLLNWMKTREHWAPYFPASTLRNISLEHVVVERILRTWYWCRSLSLLKPRCFPGRRTFDVGTKTLVTLKACRGISIVSAGIIVSFLKVLREADRRVHFLLWFYDRKTCCS